MPPPKQSSPSEKGFILSEKALARTDLDYELALNTDLKEIGAPFFPSDVERRSRKLDYLENPKQIVLQIKSIKNTSSSKVEETQGGVPRLLRISLSDGHSVMHAVELSPLDNISTDTPPGTKVRLLEPNIKILSGFLLLKKGSLKVLGGCVEKLLESWENSRMFSSFKREVNNGANGPPPWIPFGKEMTIDAALLRETPEEEAKKKKSEADKSPKDEEPTEFDSQRKGAIEEASGLQKKSFGGGRQEIKDGKRDLSKREEIQLRRKGRRGGNKENDGESKPPPSLGINLGQFLLQKEKEEEPKCLEVEDDGFEPIPPELQAQFDREAKLGAEEERNNKKMPIRELPSLLSNDSRHPPPARNDSDRRGGHHARRGGASHARGQQEAPRGRQQRSQRPRENSDLGDFGEWNNSTYEDTHGRQRQPARHQQQNNNRQQYRGESRSFNNDTSQQQRQPPRHHQQRQNHSQQQSQNYDHQQRQNNRHHQQSQNYDHQGRQNNRHHQQSQNHDHQQPQNHDHQQPQNHDRQQPQNHDHQQPQNHDHQEPQNNRHQQHLQNYDHQQRQNNRHHQQSQNNDHQQPQNTNHPQHHNPSHQSHQNNNNNPHSQQHHGESRTFSNRTGRRPKVSWKINDQAMARYWEDNKYYHVTITDLSETTAVVLYKEYGNAEEVLLEDLKPIEHKKR